MSFQPYSVDFAYSIAGISNFRWLPQVRLHVKTGNVPGMNSVDLLKREKQDHFIGQSINMVLCMQVRFAAQILRLASCWNATFIASMVVLLHV